MGMLGSNLFIRTWNKGEKTYIAMESRCYNGSIKTLKEPESIKSIGARNILTIDIIRNSSFHRSISLSEFQNLLNDFLNLLI